MKSDCNSVGQKKHCLDSLEKDICEDLYRRVYSMGLDKARKALYKYNPFTIFCAINGVRTNKNIISQKQCSKLLLATIGFDHFSVNFGHNGS